MLGCLIAVYNFFTPGTKAILCVLRTDQHSLNGEGLCISVVQSWKYLLRGLMNPLIDMNHMDCEYALRTLISCSKKVYGKKSDPCHGIHYFF